MSGWVAKVVEDWERFGASIVWMRDSDGRRHVSNGETVWTVDPGNPTVPEVEPLRLPDEMLRALNVALLRYFNGADDARMLRKDYDAERARVDRLMELFFRQHIPAVTP